MADLQQFLDKYKLSSYAEALAEYGIESIDDLLDLNDDDVAEAADECNMKKLHKKKFIKGFNELKSGGGGGAPAAVVPQQQYVAPTQPQQQQYTAPQVQQTQPQAQAQPAAEPEAEAEPEEKKTEEELLDERAEQLAMQNPELMKKMQDEGLMENYAYFTEHDEDDPYCQQLLQIPGFAEFCDEMFELYEKAASGEINPNPLVKCSIEELSKENINSYRCKMGALGFVMGKNVSANDDIIASNDFCQIAVGKRLFIEKDEDENAQEEEKPLPLGWVKNFTPEGKPYYQHLVTKDLRWDPPVEDEKDDEYKVNRRPRDDSIDMDVRVTEAQPDLVHAGVIHEFNAEGILDISGDASCPPIGFTPGTNNFTICCEVYCLNPSIPNAICANGLIDFFIFQSKVTVRTNIHRDLTNIGNVKLIPQFWYHIGIVCERKQITIDDGKDKGKKIDATEFKIYMDGVEAGIISLNGISNLDRTALIGRIPTETEEDICNSFTGAIENFKLFYRDLSEDEIFTIASNEDNKSYKPTKMITYQPGSLKIELPKHYIKYNGPIYGKLPNHLAFTCTEMQELSISAYIMLYRANSKHGSIVLSNRSLFMAFELICPLPKTNVIGMKFNGDVITLGKTKFRLNRFYHISLAVKREDNETRFVAFVNGKQDGSYIISGSPNITNSADWDIGFRESKPIKTRFEGSIQNLRIFNYALCEAETASLYAADIRECNFLKNKEILYVVAKGSNECPKCKAANTFAQKFCSKCRAPLKETSMLQFENKQTGKSGVSGKEWAQAFNDAAQTYAEQEYGVSYQDPNAEEKTQEEIQFEMDAALQRAIKHQTEYNFLEWETGIFMSKDIKKGTVTILDSKNKQKVVMLNEIIKPAISKEDAKKQTDFVSDESGLITIPATDALNNKLANIGGWIVGRDFHGNKWKLLTNEPGFVKYLVTPSCFNQLTSLQRFPKYTFLKKINNINIRNFYILNRLLYASFELLKVQCEPFIPYEEYVTWNKDKKNKKKSKEKKWWNYFNEYILPWTKIWSDQPNGECVCGNQMEQMQANEAYDEYEGIGCDQCGKQVDGDAIVFHCMKQQTLQHEMGYDSCWECQKEANFDKLKRVSRILQKKFAEKNFALFEQLLSINKNWKLFDLQSGAVKKFISNNRLGPRQNLIDGGMTIEIKDINKLDPNIKYPATTDAILATKVIGKDANTGADILNPRYDPENQPTNEHRYDQEVVTMLLWGRCKLLNGLFQGALSDMFQPFEPAMVYSAGPIKTYERMMEKADEYRFEDLKPFPCSFSICDVNRCSIKCETLDDVLSAYNMVEKSPLFEIVRVKNRFSPIWDPKAIKNAGGYRDMLVNVYFKDPRQDPLNSGLAVVAEVQFHLNGFEHIKHYQHKLYKIQRAQDQISLLKNYEARKFDDKKKKEKKKAAAKK